MIEEDAFAYLKNVLDCQPEKEKVEKLVSKCFESRLNGQKQVVTLFDVVETLNQLNIQTSCNQSTKRLYRLPNDKIIAGVCSGVGEYFSVDPVVVRIAFLMLVPIMFTGIFSYLICWIVIPQKPVL
jgi:phage shock protein PspC (stress-responsive transcriptional regulator)